MILIVTYDLRGPRDYTPLYDAIKAQGTWWHYLTSTWLISTPKRPDEVWNALQPHIDEKDNILIAELGQQHYGWLPRKAWDWITQQQAADAIRTLMSNPTEQHTKTLAEVLSRFGKRAEEQNKAVAELLSRFGKPAEEQNKAVAEVLSRFGKRAEEQNKAVAELLSRFGKPAEEQNKAVAELLTSKPAEERAKH